MSYLSQATQRNQKNSFINERIDGLFAHGCDIMDGIKIVLTFDENGTICNCNHTVEILLDFVPDELIGQPIKRVLPELADTKQFLGKRNIPKLIFLSRIGYRFEVVRKYGTHFLGNLFFSDVKNDPEHQLRVIICPAG